MPMQQLTIKQYDELCEELINNLGLDFFEDDEIDHVLFEIESYGPAVRSKVLALILALSHASSSLVPGVLRHIRIAAGQLSPADLDEWLGAAFELRDSRGIDQALRFMSRVDSESLRAYRARDGLSLREASPLLETFLRALSGRELKITDGDAASTDTVVKQRRRVDELHHAGQRRCISSRQPRPGRRSRSAPSPSALIRENRRIRQRDRMTSKRSSTGFPSAGWPWTSTRSSSPSARNIF